MTTRGWQGIVAVEGTHTVDGRLIAPGALTWSTPLPVTRIGGYDPIGATRHVWRYGGYVWARGDCPEDGLLARFLDGAGDAGVGVAIELTHVDAEDNYGGWIFTAGMLATIAVTDEPAWRCARIFGRRQ